MGMHAEGKMGVVLENDFQRIASLTPKHGADDAKVVPPGFTRLQCSERSVGVLSIYRFPVDPANALWTVLYEEPGPLIVGLAGHMVYLGRGVVPIHFIGRDVVSAGCACALKRALSLSALSRQNRKQPPGSHRHNTQ